MDGVIHQLGISSAAADSNLFWYSRQAAGVAVLVYFLILQALSGIIPPLQAPDEITHLSRAYLLSKGEVFLGTRGGVTGGEIDSGLAEYMNLYQRLPLQYEKKLTASDLRSSHRMAWSGRRQFFINLSNTALYFPLPYLPQAFAFALGEHLQLSLDATYDLARLFSRVTTLGLLWAALLLYPMPIMVIALFAMPMTLFQLA